MGFGPLTVWVEIKKTEKKTLQGVFGSIVSLAQYSVLCLRSCYTGEILLLLITFLIFLSLSFTSSSSSSSSSSSLIYQKI
jgi:hypothetical protein